MDAVLTIRAAGSTAARVAGCLLALACSTAVRDNDATRPGSEETEVMIQDERFKDLPLGTNVETACTPRDPGGGWRGILIDAPAVVVLERSATPIGYAPLPPIPVCGRLKLPILEMPADGVILLTARETKTDRTLTGRLGEKDASSIEEDTEEPLDPALFEGVATTDYFNADLTATVGLPALPATYEVQARMGTFVSNSITLVIRAP